MTSVIDGAQYVVELVSSMEFAFESTAPSSQWSSSFTLVVLPSTASWSTVTVDSGCRSAS